MPFEDYKNYFCLANKFLIGIFSSFALSIDLCSAVIIHLHTRIVVPLLYSISEVNFMIRHNDW